MGNPNQKPEQNSELHQQDDQGEDQQQEEETFTCEICIETVTLPNIKFKNNNKCVHPFCTECMIKYIQVKLEDNQSDITCPATTCKHSLEPLSCRLKIPNQLFNKWCDALCESSVLGVDKVYCPNIECMELILNECGDRNMKRCVCPHCKKPFYFECKAPYTACRFSLWTDNDENDLAFGVLYKKKKWMMCPGCGYCVEHVGGCNMVRCRCGTRFCYKCRERRCLHGDEDASPLLHLVVYVGLCMFVFLVALIVEGFKS